MKRPEGFGQEPAPESPAPPKARRPRAARPARLPRNAENPSERGRKAPERPRPDEFSAVQGQATERKGRPERRPRQNTVRPARDTTARDARRALRRAAAERKRYERAELKRFTRRLRARRAAVGTTIGVVALVVALLAVAIFSPVLSLRTVTVDGTARVDAAALKTRLEEQLGTPLALVDYGRFDAVLRDFPVIQSYSTETIPPGTIAVHIVERQPIVTVRSAAGTYLFVDAAGVTIEQSAERLPGVPLVTESGTTIPNPAFAAAVEVLLAMPAELRGQIDTITAKTRDDVTLVFAGTPQTVRWGSANDSVRKAELLAALRNVHGATPGTFDVSATTNGVFRPA